MATVANDRDWSSSRKRTLELAGGSGLACHSCNCFGRILGTSCHQMASCNSEESQRGKNTLCAGPACINMFYFILTVPAVSARKDVSADLPRPFWLSVEAQHVSRMLVKCPPTHPLAYVCRQSLNMWAACKYAVFRMTRAEKASQLD